MSNIITKYKTPLSLLLIIINALPLLAIFTGHISGGNVIYFYWAECAFLGAASLFVHTKRLIVFLVLLCTALLITEISSYKIIVPLPISLTFWSLYYLLWLGYTELGKSRYWEKIRHEHPLEQFLYYLVFMGLSIMVTFAATATIFDGWSIIPHIKPDVYAVFLTLTISVPTLSIGLLKIIDMIGPRHFLHFIFGTYHSAVKQDKIVLFLDMANSSTMAEKLSPEKSLDIIARFIFDSSAIFRRHGGDILNYTGDGLVVVWPKKQSNRVFSAIIQLCKTLDSSRPVYKKLFGFSPDFRIGVHTGPIVMKQIGEGKLFLGLYGDVVNTAARLEQMNKALKTRILLSEAFIKDLSPANMALLKDLGKKNVRGRKETIKIFTIKNKE